MDGSETAIDAHTGEVIPAASSTPSTSKQIAELVEVMRAAELRSGQFRASAQNCTRKANDARQRISALLLDDPSQRVHVITTFGNYAVKLGPSNWPDIAASEHAPEEIIHRSDASKLDPDTRTHRTEAE